jgi:hypothetical protein
MVFGKDCKYFQGNDKTYGPYDYAYSLGFSPDGSKYVLHFNKDIKEYIQINDKVYGPYDASEIPSFSDNGSKYAWWFGKNCTFQKKIILYATNTTSK